MRSRENFGTPLWKDPTPVFAAASCCLTTHKSSVQGAVGHRFTPSSTAPVFTVWLTERTAWFEQRCAVRRVTPTWVTSSMMAHANTAVNVIASIQRH